MHKNKTLYAIEIFSVIATIAIMMSMIDAPVHAARRPPSVIAPAINLMSGVKACSVIRTGDEARLLPSGGV
jgi:hypothetical protein